MATEPEQLASDPPGTPPSVPTGSYYFLDVGRAKYGECVLVTFGERRVLIDGSHQQDFRGQRGYRSIPQQLRDVLGGSAPYDLDLVVVTHGHADHVGCMPELVEKEVIRPKYALLTHPKFGFGRTMDEDVDGVADRLTRRLEAALREEDASDLDDAELEAFIDAAETVEVRYARFVADLRARNVEVIEYVGDPLPAPVAALLAPTGIELLGPSEEQILLCAEQISRTNKEAADAIAASGVVDAGDVVQLYRSLVSSREADAGYSRGNAMNCQSITLAFGPPGAKVLLAGDMQFAEPGVRGADAEVLELRARVAAAGPYAVFKTTHHTSHNGFDEALLEALGHPGIIVHSGGLRDEDHPHPGLLSSLRERGGIRFARTDRNGLVTVRPGQEEDVATARGELNDFSVNTVPDEEARSTANVTPGRPGGGSTAASSGVSVPLNGPQIIIVNLPPGPVDITVAGVGITVREVGPRAGAGSVQGGSRAPRRSPDHLPGPHGDLDGLLFVTDVDRLRENVGRVEADGVVASIESRAGALLHGHGDELSERSVGELRGGASRRGVVIVGGYDVVPAHRVNTLDPELRQRLRRRDPGDNDQFWVWSDAAYADVDRDGLEELPVSRVPDARDARLLQRAFAAAPRRRDGRFGIRNVYRPFADEIWKELPGTRGLNVSEPFLSGHLEPDHLNGANHYLMLHGDHADGTEFTGEDRDGYPVAFTIQQVPRSFGGVVFSGCCWGALIVDGRAIDHPEAAPPPRVVEASIALSYLKAGALAFVGCTGAHYSGPSTDPEVNLAFRLHDGFWSHLRESGSPARALYEAKRDFAEAIVAVDQPDPLATARRLKNLAQFTCLGLGWT